MLAIRLLRSGFDEALASACLEQFLTPPYPTYEAWRSAKTTSPVRVQWDPERVRVRPPRHRSIQGDRPAAWSRATLMTGLTWFTDDRLRQRAA